MRRIRFDICDPDNEFRLTALSSASTKNSRRYRRRLDLSLESLLLAKVAAIRGEFVAV